MIVIVATYLMYIIYTCIERHIDKTYPFGRLHDKKEFIKDLVIPFRGWCLALWKLFQD